MASFNEAIVLPEAFEAPTIDIVQREATHVGSRYEGAVSVATGRREGHGKYMYPNSFFTYEGEWLNGKKHGRGRLSLGQDGDYYEGDFELGEILGQGSQYWRDGTVYTGQFVSGERHGQGGIERPDGSMYSGAWARNKYSGQGELLLPGGDTYTGQFKAHKYHGQGVFTQPSADRRYDGCFEAGLFEGEGELKERGGAFVYTGQFQADSMAGEGKGTDTASGIAYSGAWKANQPTSRSVAWDMAAAKDHERAGESFISASEALREEAADQQDPAAADPKAKAKAKGKAAAAPVATEEPNEKGPELELFPGQLFPEVVLRLVDSDSNPFSGESGRRWKVTMFRERRVPKEEDPSEMEILRREVRFGDERKTYVDPLDEAQATEPAAKGGKGKSPSPEPPAEDASATPEPEPYAGEASMDGAVGDQGEVVIGNGEAWRLPVHLLPLIYWLRIEDTTEGISSESFCQLLPPLEFPIRVKAPPE